MISKLVCIILNKITLDWSQKMEHKTTYISSHDGQKIFLRIWNQVEKPIGIVQIIHGMAEHSARYEMFAHFLNKKGYIVYADDHRGHGHSLTEEEVLGYIGDDGFQNIVKDEQLISELIKKKYPKLPLFIFAHSFGSFIGQEYIVQNSRKIDGIILSGSAKQNGLDAKMGRILATIQNAVLDNKKEAKLIDKLSFGIFNKKFKNQQPTASWLTRDTKVLEQYKKDELSGFVSSINFYYELFHAFKSLYQNKRLEKIEKDLPLLIISGDMDPVGKYGVAVQALYEQYKQLDLENVTLKLFEDARHELVNELNNQEVFSYINDWFSKVI